MRCVSYLEQFPQRLNQLDKVERSQNRAPPTATEMNVGLRSAGNGRLARHGKRASPWIAEGFSLAAHGAYWNKFSISIISVNGQARGAAGCAAIYCGMGRRWRWATEMNFGQRAGAGRGRVRRNLLRHGMAEAAG